MWVERGKGNGPPLSPQNTVCVYVCLKTFSSVGQSGCLRSRSFFTHTHSLRASPSPRKCAVGFFRAKRSTRKVVNTFVFGPFFEVVLYYFPTSFKARKRSLSFYYNFASPSLSLFSLEKDKQSSTWNRTTRPTVTVFYMVRDEREKESRVMWRKVSRVVWCRMAEKRGESTSHTDSACCVHNIRIGISVTLPYIPVYRFFENEHRLLICAVVLGTIPYIFLTLFSCVCKCVCVCLSRRQK